MGYGDYPDLTDVKKILVIKLRHLGDVLLTTPLFTHLKKSLPQATIDAFVYRESLPLLEGNPSIDHLLSYDRSWKKLPWLRRLQKELALWRAIRRGGYDLVINLTEGDRGTLAALLSGAKIRVGFPPKGRWQKRVYTHRIKEPRSLRHTVEKNLDALRRIGLFPTEEERKLFFPLSPALLAEVKQKWGSDPFILIHPTSRWRFKCWPTGKMRQLVQELVSRGKRVILTAGPDPLEIAMAGEIGASLPVLNLAGKVSLKELGALIALSETLICVDSLPFHLASALKKRVIALFGPTSEITWGPWENPHATILTQPLPCRPCYLDGCGGSKVSDCLATLPLSRVLEAMEEVALR